MKLIQTYLTEHNGRAPPDIQRPLRSPKFEKCVDSQWDACDDRNMDIRPLYD